MTMLVFDGKTPVTIRRFDDSDTYEIVFYDEKGKASLRAYATRQDRIKVLRDLLKDDKKLALLPLLLLHQENENEPDDAV
jgi:hypothetical protein